MMKPLISIPYLIQDGSFPYVPSSLIYTTSKPKHQYTIYINVCLSDEESSNGPVVITKELLPLMLYNDMKPILIDSYFDDDPACFILTTKMKNIANISTERTISNEPLSAPLIFQQSLSHLFKEINKRGYTFQQLELYLVRTNIRVNYSSRPINQDVIGEKAFEELSNANFLSLLD